MVIHEKENFILLVWKYPNKSNTLLLKQGEFMSKIPKNEVDFIEEYTAIKFTWYQRLYLKIRRLFILVKVAFHRPYMIKAILTTRCPQCGRYFSFPKIREQNTRYHDKYSNYFCGCKDCEEENDKYWKDMWSSYWSSVL